jgi:large subunit ribosomal protein L25
MENVITLKADPRNDVGKKIAKRLRKQGRIPAIIYGEKKESIPISLLLSDVKTIMKGESGENTVLRIHREDVRVDAMLKEVQYDYLSDNIIHVDLLRIDLEKAVNVSVPVKVFGEPVGVKVEGGIFDFMTREIKIRCLPTQIPKEFEVDISGLHPGNSIKTEDLEVGEGIKVLSDPHTVICAVTIKVAVEEEVVEEEVVEEAEAEAAAEGEEKPEEPQDKEKQKQTK